MGYEKRIAVLKQIRSGYSESGRPLAGIFKMENYAGRATAEVSLLNARAGKFYAAISTGGGESYRFAVENLLKTRAELPGSPDISGGAACLILEGEDYRPVAFGASGLVDSGIEEMRRTFVESIRVETARRAEAPGGVPLVLRESPPPAAEKEVEERLQAIYEDEVVAGENYYLNPDVDMETLSIKSPEGEKEVRDEHGGGKDGGTEGQDLPQEERGAAGAALSDDEADAGAFAAHADDGAGGGHHGEQAAFGAGGGENAGRYYDRVAEELEKVFRDHPSEEILNKNVPDSRWAKVPYGEGRHYAVGVISSGGAPAYICYGVPGKYQSDPPKELKGYCSYMPLSLFDLTGEGYWMMFQDAETGECAHIDFV